MFQMFWPYVLPPGTLLLPLLYMHPFFNPHVKSAVLLPHKKVTPQQLSQPLGSGAAVFEIPGVFDDCMKVVEALI